MKKTWIFIIIFAVSAMVASAYIYNNAKAKGDKEMILGYTTGDNDSYKSLTSFHKYINTIATDTFSFNENGYIVGATPENELVYAKKKQIKTYAVISNFGETDFDAELAHIVMTDKEAKNRFIKQLISLSKENGYSGVNIDFEAINPIDRSNYSNLIKAVSSALHKEKVKTMVSVPAKSSDDKKNDWTWPYDYKQIGKYADYVQVMTYDEHGSWGDSGSIASRDWLQDTLDYSIKNIKSKKILMGIPAYGYDWNLDDSAQNKLVQWDYIQELLKKHKVKPTYDKVTASVFFTYNDNQKQKHVVWYENVSTIEKKTKLVKKYKLGGVSVYALGHESTSFWKAIQQGIK